MDSDRLRKWGIRWKVAPGYGWIFEGDGLKGLLTGTSGQTLRLLSKRRVLRGRHTGRSRSISLFAKIYRPPRFPLSLFKSKGMREYETLREAERRGVRTIRAIAVGEARRMGVLLDSYLLTEEMAGSTPLSEVHLQSVELRARRRSIHSLAVALRNFHERGVLHKDLHSGNILLLETHSGAAAELDVLIIDLHGARFSPSLTLEERVKNLIQLNTYYGLVLSRTDRLFFLKSYGYGLGLDIKDLAAAVEEGAVRARWRLWQRRRKRYLHDGKYAHFLKCDGYRGFISAPRDTKALRGIIRDPPVAYGKGLVIKSSRTNRVASLRTEGGEHIVIKWHRPPSPVKKAGTFMRPSRGRKAWCGARGLAERMIGCPEAIAFLDRRRLGFVMESFFIADFLERAIVLPHYVREKRHGMSVRQRRTFCREMGKFLADLHRRGVCHTDLKGSNIMVEEGAGGGLLFYLIDPEAVRFMMSVPQEVALRNLSRLDRYMRPHISATDRLATLYSYLAALGSPGLLKKFR